MRSDLVPYAVVNSVFHPTDFSRGSESAFIHALKLTIAAKARLEIVHVDRHPERIRWEAFPQVRKTLARWGALPEGAAPSEVRQLGIGVEKLITHGKDAAEALLHRLDESQPDLVVMATHPRHGVDRWLHRDVAKKVSRLSKLPALFVPHGVQGFVHFRTGVSRLRRLLIPVTDHLSAWPAVDVVSSITGFLACELVEATLLHVDEKRASVVFPELGNRAGWTCETIVEAGDPATAILETAEEREVDLIALTTQGRHGFLDVLRGSTTEQVVRSAECCVLAVPISWQ